MVAVATVPPCHPAVLAAVDAAVFGPAPDGHRVQATLTAGPGLVATGVCPSPGKGIVALAACVLLDDRFWPHDILALVHADHCTRCSPSPLPSHT